MPARPAAPLPTRGVPNGWLDPWEQDEAAAVRAAMAAAERRLLERAAAIGAALRAEDARRKARESRNVLRR